MDTSPDFLFVGDSITDAGRDRSDPRSLGDGYVSLLAQRLAPATVRNAGIAGNRAIDLEQRWAEDVLALTPAVLTVYIGVNDTWRRYDGGDETPADRFARTCRGLLASATARDSAPQLILMEPFLLPVRTEQNAWLGDLDGKRSAVRALASEFGAALVPLHDVLSDAAAAGGGSALAPDGVHPTPAASRLIADAWWRSYSPAPIH